MNASDISIVILAAGLGKRMKSGLAKVLHPVGGKPMVLHPVEAALTLSPRRTIVVAGHQAEKVREVLSPYPVQVALQEEPKGTADAVARAMALLKGETGSVLILCGDTPLLRPETLADLLKTHRSGGGPLTLLTAVTPDPAGYGRIIRENGNGPVVRIVEEKDASPEIRAVKEVNTGIYVFDLSFLAEALSEVRAENAQKEFYLTDTIEIAVRHGAVVRGIPVKDPEEWIGINSRVELAAAERVLRSRIVRRWMEEGVTFLSPETALIDADVSIDPDVVIYPNVVIEGKSRIGSGSTIYPNNRISESELGRKVKILDGCLIESSRIDDGAAVGPFAHLRPGSVLEKNVKVGNFVELKKAHMKEGAKANHLTYLGDAEIGREANIGAGTITCNYDGVHKHVTRIGERVFVGSDVQLVAPVVVGDGAFIAAGTTVTKDVPPEALAISRTEQVNKEGWAKKRKKK